MDKNTIIGLSLIGVILVTFTIFNQPSESDIKKEKAKIEAENKRSEKEQKKAAQSSKDSSSVTSTTSTGSVTEKKEKYAPKTDKKGNQLVDSIGNPLYINTLTKLDTVFSKEDTPNSSVATTASNFKGELIRLESDKFIVDLSTKGGVVAAVQLKEFETYKQFSKEDGKIIPLYLFKEDDQVNQLVFPLEGKEYTTGNKEFTLKSKSKNKVVLTHEIAGGSIDFIYSLKGGYDIDFSVQFNGLGKEIQPKNVQLDWVMKMRKTERLLSEQRKISTVCYQYTDGSLDYLSEASDDAEAPEQNMNWLAFKQSYFSSILTPEKPFLNASSKVKIGNFGIESPYKYSHIRKYSSRVGLPLASTDNGSISMTWFFGPNDYNTLRSYDKGYDDILNLGWGLFRWINMYAVQPVFDLLNSTAMGMGIAILLLTLILKLILMPIQWKMFVSSAKMKILKPQIDEINAKYPNKDDAMKKQIDMMALYRESGASPLAGCVPMLIQMPILLAVFRFFPAAFELRQKGFLWAEDLSSYDSVWDFGTYIPVYGDHMSLFTLLMSATTLIYTYLNSSNVAQQQQPGMPNMKVIMYIFPIMMIFFFNNFASGLSYYYFISTLMTILLMFVIKQFFVDEEKLKAKMALAQITKKEAGPKKKSKFMERLETMQKQQQEQLKNRKK